MSGTQNDGEVVQISRGKRTKNRLITNGGEWGVALRATREFENRHNPAKKKEDRRIPAGEGHRSDHREKAATQYTQENPGECGRRGRKKKKKGTPPWKTKKGKVYDTGGRTTSST